MSTSFHPQTDGQSEATNKTVLQILRSYTQTHPEPWDELIVFAELAVNSSSNRATRSTPFLLTYGFHPRMPDDFVLPRTSSVETIPDFCIRQKRALATARSFLEEDQLRAQKAAKRFHYQPASIVTLPVLVSFPVRFWSKIFLVITGNPAPIISGRPVMVVSSGSMATIPNNFRASFRLDHQFTGQPAIYLRAGQGGDAVV